MIAALCEAPMASAADPLSTPWFSFVWLAVSIVILSRFLPGVLSSEPRAHVGWNLGHVFLVVGVMFVSIFTLGAVLHRGSDGLPGPDGATAIPKVHANGLELLMLSAASDLACVFVALGIASRTGSGNLSAVGIQPGRAFSAPARAIAAFVIAIPGGLATAVIWVWCLQQFGVTEFEQPIVAEIRNIAADDRLPAVMLGVLVIPLCEEILFRGFLQPLLVQMWGVAGGIMVTSLVFSALHGMAAFLPIFALSCLLGLVMVRTQRLHAAWAVHALFNGFQFLMIYAYPEFVDHHSAPGTVLTANWMSLCSGGSR